MTVTVIIPTYRRPQELARCLNALTRQTRPADEVIVIVRDTDTETWAFLDAFDHEPLPLRTVTVRVTGVVAAMNAGLEGAQGDIIAFTDDDAEPHADWLERIEAHFEADDGIGGVGGRDQMYIAGTPVVGERKVVGRLQWFGRMRGFHHLGIGAAREVDILKGVNMSFRRTAIGALRFDERMRGTGAQVHFEVAFCLTLKRRGWRLLYDPAVLVDHYPAMRFDEDQRAGFNATAFANAVHNETVALLDHRPPLRRVVFYGWAFLIGTRKALGLVQWLRFLPREGALAGQKWRASIHGRREGWRTWRQSKRKRSGLS